MPKPPPKSLKAYCQRGDILRLAYIDSEGYPRVVPLWFVVIGDRYCIGTAASSPKCRAIKRNPRVGWVIDGGQDHHYKGISLRGRASQVKDPRLRAKIYRALGKKYFGSPKDPDFVSLYGEVDDPETAYFQLEPMGGHWWQY